MTSTDHPSALVVGAGIFGACTVLSLARRGWEVTLIEQHSPGHTRASSGGESRLFRLSHGTDVAYTRMAKRSLIGWDRIEEETGSHLMARSGLVWFARREEGWEADSLATLEAEGVPVERLDGSDAAAMFPSLRHDDLAFVLYEPDAGVLYARQAVQAVVAEAAMLGTQLVSGRAEPCPDTAGVLLDGERCEADRVVWACGPWLPAMFPEVLAPTALRVTKQDVTFFGAGPEWGTPPVPGWVDYDAAAYGLGDLDGRGVKCAPDVEGPAFDPEHDDRVLSQDNERRAREYIAHRFPALATAPLLGSRTCQYTLTPDTAFLIAPHPSRDDVWFVGGGSGHGFKHGPVIGEDVADLLDGVAEPEPRFGVGPRSERPGLRTAGGRGPGPATA